MTSLTTQKTNVKKNPAYTRWVCQVNANYHSGMSEADAEQAAGIAPLKWQVGNFFTSDHDQAVALAASLSHELVSEFFAQAVSV